MFLFVFMARYVMILMRANPFRGPLEGMGPKLSSFGWRRDSLDKNLSYTREALGGEAEIVIERL
jgi:hypothetical protein